MTKHEFIKEVATRVGKPQTEINQILTEMSSVALTQIAETGRFELPHFGVFTKKHRKARTARNLQTKEIITVPEKDVVTCKPCKAIRELF